MRVCWCCDDRKEGARREEVALHRGADRVRTEVVWVCDLIVATDDAQFRDTTVDLGFTGVEMFMHPYELGTRKAGMAVHLGLADRAGSGSARHGQPGRADERAENRGPETWAIT